MCLGVCTRPHDQIEILGKLTSQDSKQSGREICERTIVAVNFYRRTFIVSA